MTARWCSHCDLDPATRRDGLCQACAAYRRKYGQTPPDHVVAARTVRRDDRRLEQLAWGDRLTTGRRAC